MMRRYAMSLLDEVSSIIRNIYDSALSADNWKCTLKTISETFDATATTVALQSSSSSFPIIYTDQDSIDALREYADKFVALDPVMKFTSTAQAGTVYLDRMVLPKEDLV